MMRAAFYWIAQSAHAVGDYFLGLALWSETLDALEDAERRLDDLPPLANRDQARARLALESLDLPRPWVPPPPAPPSPSARELERIRKAINEAASDWRRSAEALRREADAGVSYRQSVESKLARADVLESCADRIARRVDAFEIAVAGEPCLICQLPFDRTEAVVVCGDCLDDEVHA